MIRAVVAGAAGRMGKRIIHMIHQNQGIELVGALERSSHPDLGKDAGAVAGIGEVGVPVSDSIRSAASGADVIIDFTTPEATIENLRIASDQGLAAVIGTTGLAGALLDEARNLGARIRCVMAPNMSVGVNVMFKVASELARVLGNDYDMEILEVHHRMKKDAPSGTAMKLAQVVAEAVGRDIRKVGIYERKGMIGQRSDQEIGIQTWRAGDITGEHTIMFGGIGERLELTHRAHNRDNFARGAVRAALWVVGQPEGLYDMQDVLGLK
ncbi:MAG: 4-hydroxy-tetrahydrodipicolinate reductase [Desulfobacteraceae bacterium]|jgi:4-hydroxy-tetrahydrodipicolinate reductase|nr:MAG: 4-hydroxy-tetrahydrodipicolinate reductase [Desulfobacteraceae bacterium]